MERFGYNGGCAVSECPRIKAFKKIKEELAWAIDKRLRIIINIMLFKTVILLRI